MSVVSKYVTKVTALTTPSNPYAKKNKAVLKALAEAGYSRAIFKAAATYFDEYADYTVYDYSLAIGYHVALKDITAADRRAMSELVTKKAIKLGFAVTDSTGVIFIPRGMDFLKAIGEDRTPENMATTYLKQSRKYYGLNPKTSSVRGNLIARERFEHAKGTYSITADNEIHFDVYGVKLKKRQVRALNADIKNMSKPKLSAVLNDLSDVHTLEASHKRAAVLRLLNAR